MRIFINSFVLVAHSIEPENGIGTEFWLRIIARDPHLIVIPYLIASIQPIAVLESPMCVAFNLLLLIVDRNFARATSS